MLAAAIVGIVFAFLRVSGVAIPPWLVQIFWIVVAAVVAIGFVASL